MKENSSEALSSKAALEAIPVLTATLEERPEHGRIVLKCLAELTLDNEQTSNAIPSASGGRGVDVIVEALQSAADGSAESTASRMGSREEDSDDLVPGGNRQNTGSKTTISQKKVRDAMTTLANVANIPECLQYCINSRAHTAALNILTESAAEANEELSEANLTLLAKMAADASVVKELIEGSIFELIGATIAHHCSSPEAPCEPQHWPCLHFHGSLQRLAAVLQARCHRVEWEMQTRQLVSV